MSRMHLSHLMDGEIGRGRNDDSSSSRESSPERPQKRSFSPTSDDGDLVMPPIAFDDTPPPPERPILRQPVAFAWSSSTSVAAAAPVALNTYEASLPPASTITSTFFLPGQEVPPPAPKKRGSGSRAKKSDPPAKKRRTDYSAQTNRFRLKTYDPSPSAEPPIRRGDGPYSSLYRGASGKSPPPPPRPPPQTPLSPAATLTSSVGGDNASMASPSPAPESSAGQPQTTNKRPKQPPRKAKSTAAAKAAKPKATVGTATASTSSGKTAESSSGPPQASSSNSSSTAGAYYRRDYERSTVSQEREPIYSPVMNEPERYSPVPNPVPHDSHIPALPAHTTQPTTSSSGQYYEGKTTDPKSTTPKQPLRMVTLLIQDIRSGVTDHQLAEVKVPLKATDDPEDGFWADAKTLSEQLQGGPSRIDGPAKVYTLRGKYRQFFLRVTADNVDEFISTNIVIKPDRILDIVVEELLPPGKLPLPPRIPRDLRRSPTPESRSPSPQPQKDAFYEAYQEQRRTQERALQSFLDSRPHESTSAGSSIRDLSPHASSRSPFSHYEPHISNLPPKRKRSFGYTSMSAASFDPSYSPPGSFPRIDSPLSDDESHEVDQRVADAIDPYLQQDSGWPKFFQARAALQPQRALDVWQQYQFVQRMIDRWAGRRAPFRSSHHVIQPIHITMALKIEDPNFSSACTETLSLLELYGENGKRYEDSRVIAMLNDKSRPEYNSKPIKRMLHLLREIDIQWKQEHPEKSSIPEQLAVAGPSTTPRSR